jgi:hypothetical protein
MVQWQKSPNSAHKTICKISMNYQKCSKWFEFLFLHIALSTNSKLTDCYYVCFSFSFVTIHVMYLFI